MASYTSTRAGNWSSTATWGGSGPPGPGDTATIAVVGSAISGAANNGSGLVRLTVASTASWSTGQYAYVAGVTGTTEANGLWVVTVVDGTHLDLQGSAFANAYVSGGQANGVVSVDVNTTTGSTASALIGVTIGGTSATAMGYLIVQSGVTLTLQGFNTSTGAMMQVNRFGIFNPLSGSTVAGSCTADYASKIVNNGIISATGVTFTSPSSSYSWATQVTNESDAPGLNVYYDTPARVGCFGLANAWISNAAGTGPGSFGNSSLSFRTGAGISGMPAASLATSTAITNAVNNGSGLIRLTATGHGLSTGYYAVVASVGGVTNANGTWVVTVIDANTLDLQGSTFSGTYTSGGTVTIGACGVEVSAASMAASDILAVITAPGQFVVNYDCGVIYLYFASTSGPTFTTTYKHLAITGGWGISTGANNTTYCSATFANCTFQYMGGQSTATSAALVSQNAKSNGAGGTSQVFKVSGCTVTNCAHFINIASGTGTAADPILITGNTFGQCNPAVTTNPPGAVLINTGNSYISVTNNTVYSRSIFLYGTTFGSIMTATGFVFTGNSGAIGGMLNSVGPGACVWPDAVISNNTFDGFGGVSGNPWIQDIGGTSGHPAIVSGNKAYHYYDMCITASYLTLSGNNLGATYDAIIRGSGTSSTVRSFVCTNNFYYGPCGPDLNPYGDEAASFSLGTKNGVWIDGAVIANNTSVGNPNGGWDLGNYLVGGAAVLTGVEVRNNLSVNAAPSFNTACCGAQRVPQLTATNSGTAWIGVHALELDFNGYYADGCNYRNIMPGSQFYLSGSKYNYLTSPGRNVTGVALHTPGYATAPGPMSLAYTITTAGQNETLAWGGGTPVQLIFGHGSLTSAGAQITPGSNGIAGIWQGTLTDTSQTWNTSIGNAACPTGYLVKFTSGVQAGNVYMVATNTATQLTITPGYSGTLPSIGDTYCIYYPEVTLYDTSGAVQGYRIHKQGKAYTSAPTASLSGGGGTLPSNPTLTIASGVISAVSGGLGGSGLTSNPTVTLTGGGGSGGAIDAMLGQVQAGIDPRSLPATSQTDSGITIAFHDVAGNPVVANLSGSTPADFQLQAGSPMIDVGSNTNGVAADYYGTTRPQASGYDIGFFEAIPAAIAAVRALIAPRPARRPRSPAAAVITSAGGNPAAIAVPAFARSGRRVRRIGRALILATPGPQAAPAQHGPMPAAVLVPAGRLRRKGPGPLALANPPAAGTPTPTPTGPLALDPDAVILITDAGDALAVDPSLVILLG
jgi:hypothetical protein